MLSKLLRYSLPALAMLLLPVVPANAQKEQFSKKKPHVNVGSTQSVSRGNLTTKKNPKQPVRATPAVRLYRF